jgi:hypothetical protein
MIEGVLVNSKHRHSTSVRRPRPLPRWRRRVSVCCPSVSSAWQIDIQLLASLLDYFIQLFSFLFLQRVETPNLANKNKEAVGVALISSRQFCNTFVKGIHVSSSQLSRGISFFSNYTIHQRHSQRTHTYPYEYTHVNLFSNYTIHRRHSQRTNIHPYEYTHVNPTPRSIFEDCAGKSSRLTGKSSSAVWASVVLLSRRLGW